MKTISYYNVLGVSEQATPDEIKKAYRNKSLRYHPDKHMNGSLKDKELASEKQKAINEAYETLSDPIKKRDHDLKIHIKPTFDRKSEWKESSRSQQDRDKAKREEQYKQKQQEKEKVKKEWANKLEEMKKAYNDVKAIEARDIDSNIKVTAWQRFIDSFKEDNTLSTTLYYSTSL
jgi:curved DNA-binding protein CbpA